VSAIRVTILQCYKEAAHWIAGKSEARPVQLKCASLWDVKWWAMVKWWTETGNGVEEVSWKILKIKVYGTTWSHFSTNMGIFLQILKETCPVPPASTQHLHPLLSHVNFGHKVKTCMFLRHCLTVLCTLLSSVWRIRIVYVYVLYHVSHKMSPFILFWITTWIKSKQF